MDAFFAYRTVSLGLAVRLVGLECGMGDGGDDGGDEERWMRNHNTRLIVG